MRKPLIIQCKEDYLSHNIFVLTDTKQITPLTLRVVNAMLNHKRKFIQSAPNVLAQICEACINQLTNEITFPLITT